MRHQICAHASVEKVSKLKFTNNPPVVESDRGECRAVSLNNRFEKLGIETEFNTLLSHAEKGEQLCLNSNLSHSEFGEFF